MDLRVPFLACERAIIAGVNVAFPRGGSTSSSTTRQKAEHAPARPIMHVRLPGHHSRRGLLLYRRHSPRQRTYVPDPTSHSCSQRGSGHGHRRAWSGRVTDSQGSGRHGPSRRHTAFGARCVRGARTDPARGSSRPWLARPARQAWRPFRELILRRPCLHFLGRSTAWRHDPLPRHGGYLDSVSKARAFAA